MFGALGGSVRMKDGLGARPYKVGHMPKGRGMPGEVGQHGVHPEGPWGAVPMCTGCRQGCGAVGGLAGGGQQGGPCPGRAAGAPSGGWEGRGGHVAWREGGGCVAGPGVHLDGWMALGCLGSTGARPKGAGPCQGGGACPEMLGQHVEQVHELQKPGGGAAQHCSVSVELGLATLGARILSCTHCCASAWMNVVCSSGVVDLRLGAGDLIRAGGVGTGFRVAMRGDGGGQQRAASVL